jgi:2-dehydropantoate 2-reductase
VAKTGPGEIHHQSVGSLTIGRYPDGITSSARTLSALFEASKVPCKLTDDVIAARWQKALWNATFNPISIIGGILDTSMMLRTSDDRAFVRKAMQEIADIAAAAGYPIETQVIERLMEATRAMPAYKTSMALDFEHGRPMEIEAILGNVVRTARDRKVAAPTLETIYALAKMVERKGEERGPRLGGRG